MLVWIVTDKEDGQPIIAASSKEKAEKLLFDYMGFPLHSDVNYLGYTPIIYSEYEDSFTGIYKFESYNPSGFGSNITYNWELQVFYLFIIEIDKEQK